MSKPVSIAFCCNHPDTGNFTGQFGAVHIGEELLELHAQSTEPSLSFHFKAEDGQGFGPRHAQGHIKVSRRTFPIIGYKWGWGNWCWDLVIVTPRTAVNLINYLKSLSFHCEAGTSTFFEIFNEPDVWFMASPELELKLLEKYGWQRP